MCLQPRKPQISINVRHVLCNVCIKVSLSNSDWVGRELSGWFQSRYVMYVRRLCHSQGRIVFDHSGSMRQGASTLSPSFIVWLEGTVQGQTFTMGPACLLDHYITKVALGYSSPSLIRQEFYMHSIWKTSIPANKQLMLQASPTKTLKVFSDRAEIGEITIKSYARQTGRKRAQ